MTDIKALTAQWHACRDAQAALRQQRRALEEEERVLGAELGALLCAIPVGALFEIAQHHYGAGRWRVLHHILRSDGQVELVAEKLKKDGSVAKGDPRVFWDLQAITVISTPDIPPAE